MPRADPSVPRADPSVPRAELSVPRAELSVPRAEASLPLPKDEGGGDQNKWLKVLPQGPFEDPRNRDRVLPEHRADVEGEPRSVREPPKLPTHALKSCEK